MKCLRLACNIEGCDNLSRNRGKGRYGPLCETHHRQKYPRNTARRQRQRLSQYDLTVQDRDKMVTSQGGCCAICGVKPDALAVDHCHATGRVRGLLCNKCNWGLGMFDDSLDIMASAASYLINSRVKQCG